MKLKFKIVSSDYCSDVNTEAGGEAICSILIFKFTYLQRGKKKISVRWNRDDPKGEKKKTKY